MAKNKKKGKKNKEATNSNGKSLLNKVKSLAGNKKVLYSLLGAAGAGIAIAALGKDKRRSLTDTVTNSVKGLGSTLGGGRTGTASDATSSKAQ
ncbi:hypothetical protein [Rufibacter sp. XAAS-G3-1]|uniref:hypothetical protein n=1 Tax=Rufibacter sp. XAAS-G3-1 TaxID=2729134 RepID=UPI0015E6B0B2|nr:hypothetical protein [Rufibacter sp. XAAS-G3-1]